MDLSSLFDGDDDTDDGGWADGDDEEGGVDSDGVDDDDDDDDDGFFEGGEGLALDDVSFDDPAEGFDADDGGEDDVTGGCVKVDDTSSLPPAKLIGHAIICANVISNLIISLHGTPSVFSRGITLNIIFLVTSSSLVILGSHIIFIVVVCFLFPHCCDSSPNTNSNSTPP
jgi:hypothetical protein